MDTLDDTKVVWVKGEVGAKKRWLGWLPVFHIPVLGGWREFVVLQPSQSREEWFVGCTTADALGVSRIALQSSVRLLLGAVPVKFFGVTEQGEQISIEVVAYGRIGEAGRYATVPLL